MIQRLLIVIFAFLSPFLFGLLAHQLWELPDNTPLYVDGLKLMLVLAVIGLAATLVLFIIDKIILWIIEGN